MTDRTKLTILDRLHTLLVIVSGSAAAIAVLTNVPKPAETSTQFLLMGSALASGYCVAFLVDTCFARIVRSLRKRLLAAIRTARVQA